MYEEETVLLFNTSPFEAIIAAPVTAAVTTKLVPVAAPIMGVTNVGVVLNTTAPDPVLVVTPVPPLATGSVPVMPVVKGNPVTLVATNDAGVPSPMALPEASK